MLIQKARTGDISILQDIAKRVIRNNYAPFLGQDAVEAFIGSGQSDEEIEAGIDRCFILRQDERFVAFAIMDNSLLHLLMVDVPYQKQGYGRELLSHIEREIFKAHPLIKLQTFEQNISAIRFYEKHGWQIKGKEYVAEMQMLTLEKARPKPHP